MVREVPDGDASNMMLVGSGLGRILELSASALHMLIDIFAKDPAEDAFVNADTNLLSFVGKSHSRGLTSLHATVEGSFGVMCQLYN